MARGGRPAALSRTIWARRTVKRAWGTQAGVELGALRAAQLTNEDRWVHPDQMRPAMPSHKSYRGIALGQPIAALP